MKKLVGACIFGQSGGPTSVINSSAAGVFTQALKEECITNVYGAAHGIRGILNEDFYDMSKESEKELALLKATPSSALGSVRYKLEDSNIDDTDYKKLVEIFKKYNIRYFFYNGGNDSMDTCYKVSSYMKKSGYDCKVIGVPKTIDNDLFGTDHCPGFGSAAKYVATTTMEVVLDARVYDTPSITIIEVMGRNAGWLTAATALASYKDLGPDLIYLPEIAFELEDFEKQVREIMAKRNNKCVVAVSEGIKTKDGKYLTQILQEDAKSDAFGHAQLGGLAAGLAAFCERKFNVKVRAVEYSLMQRCGAHIASKTDVMEAFNVGKKAVQMAVRGTTGKMVTIQRGLTKAGNYKAVYRSLNLKHCANTEKKVPLEWILPNGKGLTQDFIDYALPLIQGDHKAPLEDGLPRFAQLAKVKVTK